MKNQKILRQRIALLFAAVALGGTAIEARADYSSTVLANRPVGYWRLNETVQPPAADIANNNGSLGAAARGYYQGTVIHPMTGALAAGSDTAAIYDGVAGTATVVPYLKAMNPSSAFTIEAWLNPSVAYEVGSGTLNTAVSCGHLADPRSGWLIYQSETGWNLRMYAQSGTATSVNITGGPAPVAGTWYHVVGVYDGANAYVYVNGQQAATASVPAYVPGTDGPFYIGGRSDAAYWWSGQADEVAFYDKALSASEILAHYQNGVSASPSTPYATLIQASAPLAYYRLNEPAYTPPATLPVAKNLGSLGAVGDGSYYPGMEAGAAGADWSGFGTDNKSGGFNGMAGYVGTQASMNELSKFTVMGWLKRGATHSLRGGYFGQNDLLEFGDANSGTSIEAWINAYGANIVIPYPFPDDQWGFIALVGDGTQAVVYTNGVVAATRAGAVDSYGSSDFLFNIGGGGVFNATGDYFLGGVDEVALFDTALTAQQIQEIYYSANVPPSITEQPQAPDRILSEGNSVTLTVAATGSPTIRYQWRKDSGDLAGMTLPTLTLNNIKVADAGVYDVVVRNDYGAVTSAAVTLTIQAADTTPPTLLYATASKTFNSVRVWFSESLDPASAETVSNYQLSGGLTITSAKLSAPAGSAGDNIVDLTTSAQTPGQTYTLTVSGVKDQTSPGNPIAAGSTVQFGSWAVAAGFLRFETWSGLSTTDNNLTNTLTVDPRFPNSPTFTGFVSAFTSRQLYPDDSHEGYGGKMSGFIIPTETADYRFFLYSDDSSQLFLSKSEDPKAATLIAQETDCCDVFQEPGIANDDGETYPTSEPIRLVAGQRYYIEALWKEGGGGDYCQVAWRKETDTTPAASLQVIPAKYLGTYADPNVEIVFVQQPTDQVGVVASTGIQILSQDFNATDGGFTVENTDPAPPGPWVYDSVAGAWVADGGEDACTGPYNSRLNSAPYKLTQDGTITLSFSHRYSFEADRWDGGQVRISVNGSEFATVPAENFSENGYAPGTIQGSGILNGQRAFNADSAGYGAGEFITSKALLGTFTKNDTLVVQFVGGWDDCSTGQHPGWVIDSFKLDLLPMTIQDFSKSNGDFTVENSGTPPGAWGPWVYDATKGQWAANGADSQCGGPFNSRLNSPAYVVPQADEVTLSFSHRYSFEGDLWDGGQVRISVNGGAFAVVPPENFSANGYAAGIIQGSGILNGQPAFNGDSPGYADTNFITSSAVLGTFNQNDRIVVQFVGGWDDCSGASQPSWVIKNLQLTFGKAAKASTFEATATATQQGAPTQVYYQWQRNDGSGFVDIAGATANSFRFYPTPADFQASFRVVATVPGKSVASQEAKLVTGIVEAPEISIERSAAGITLTYTGTLQSSTTVEGPFQNVAGAQSPYVVPNPAGAQFFRSVK
ncbi:MAG TPA: immunoglobulin domain-containing protein [Candidatus Paceibacterota bacterium]|nr:immunoglobulin domain-containing protein [Candidatus Paceibacterota bacterium]